MTLEQYRHGLGVAGLPHPPNLLLVAAIDSTNRLARRIADGLRREDKGAPDLLILALAQSEGRGRLDRRWSSPAGLGVYATRLLAVAGRAEIAALPMVAAVGLCRALNRLVADRCRIKWPNDLLVDGRKIGGILIEGVAGPPAHAAIGFGVNVGQRHGDLPTPQATSLAVVLGTAPPLAEVACRLAEGLEHALGRRADPDRAIAAYRALSAHFAGDPLHCRLGGLTVRGTFDGFDGEGHLRLRVGNEERVVVAAEILEG